MDDFDFSWDTGIHDSGEGRISERLSSGGKAKETEIIRLQGQIDRLTLACQSMWELLRDRTDLNDHFLNEKIAEVDLRDGSPDGRLGSTVIQCAHCTRNTNSRRSSCVWCGVPVERVHIFEG